MGYYEVIYGSKGGKIGLLEWIKEEVERYCLSVSKSMNVYINSLGDTDEIRKGSFPSVQIYPAGDSFEKISDKCFEHETKVKLVVSTKGPREKMFRRTIEWVGDIYDHFRKTNPDLEEINCPAVKGNVDFSWEGLRRDKHRNLMLSHSAVELVYGWRM